LGIVITRRKILAAGGAGAAAALGGLVAADSETQRWWRLTDPCQEPWPDAGTGGQWSDLTEIWHLSE